MEQSKSEEVRYLRSEEEQHIWVYPSTTVDASSDLQKASHGVADFVDHDRRTFEI